jgi:hypothetical protein
MSSSFDASNFATEWVALRRYFPKGLELFPNLDFTLIGVMQGLSSVVVYYKNQRDTRTGEFIEFDDEDKVVRVVANYSNR